MASRLWVQVPNNTILDGSGKIIVIQLPMLKSSKVAFLVLCALIATLHAEPTDLTYIVQHEIDQADNYIELTLTVQTENKILTDAIQDADRVIRGIRKFATEYCTARAKTSDDKKQCKDIIEVSKYEVEPKYHMIRKVPTFALFLLSQEVTIEIKYLDGLGQLTDLILGQGEGLVTINEFAWKAHTELDPQRQALKDGIQQGQQLCGKIDKVLTDFISVEELEAGDEEVDEDRDEDLAEEEIQTTIYRFKVRCDDPPKQPKQSSAKFNPLIKAKQ